MLAVNLDFDRFDIPAIFDATPGQIKTAYRRAMGKTIRWLQTRISRELAAKFDLPQRVFQVRAKRHFDHESGQLWIGLNPIAAQWLGRARQTKKGVSVRSHRYQGAFIAEMRNGHKGVFERKNENRLPIKTVTQKITDGGSADIEANLSSYASRANAYFKRTFEHELSYVLQKVA